MFVVAYGCFGTRKVHQQNMSLLKANVRIKHEKQSVEETRRQEEENVNTSFYTNTTMGGAYKHQNNM